MNILSLFKARPERRQSDTPRTPSGKWIMPGRGIVNYNEVVAANKAMVHPMTYRCITKLAASVQQVVWFCEPDPSVPASQRAGAREIAAINDLLASPNDNLAADQLRYWLAMNYAVYRRAPFKVGVRTMGTPSGIYPLDVPFVRSHKVVRGSVVEYAYGSHSDPQYLPSRNEAVREQALSNVWRPWLYDIAAPGLSGNFELDCNATPLGSIGLPAQVMSLLLKRAIDTASGHPNTKYIVAAEKTLTNKQKQALREQIENMEPENGEDSGQILLLYNTQVTVTKLDNDLGNLHAKMPMDDMGRMICGAFNIPTALMGIAGADGAKFAGNYVESRRSFWEDTIIPMYLTPIATGMTAALCPYGARIRFDLDTIDAIVDARVARAKELVPVNFLTDNEKREICGFAPLTPEQAAELAQSRSLATSDTNAGTGSPDAQAQ